MFHIIITIQVSSVEVVEEVISATDRIMIDEDRIGAVKEESVENVLIKNCVLVFWKNHYMEMFCQPSFIYFILLDYP